MHALMPKTILSLYRYELSLVGIILLLFWPYTFQVYIPKWDSLDAYLPYRFLVSDAIRNGEFPLWHSYTYLGLPTYSDMQTGAWTPYVWIASLFGRYGIGALVVEILLCYLIAALGMFKLAHYVVKNKDIAFICALMYGLSGFMIGSSHLMVFLLGVAWLPLIFYYFLRLLRTPTLRDAVFLALCGAIYITSASPALTILTGYFLTVYVVFHYLVFAESRGIWKRTISHVALSLVLTVLLTLPFINAFIEFLPYLSRIREVVLEHFLINPFTPKDYTTLLWPYTTVGKTGLFNNPDVSTANVYFGILGLFSIFITPFLFKRKISVPVLVGIAVLFICAWGLGSGVYLWVAQLPGITTFKHTYLYMVYVIFIAVLLTGIVLKKLHDTDILHKYMARFGWGLLVLNVLVFAVSMYFVAPWEIKKTFVGVFQFVEFSQQPAVVHLALNSFLWCCIIAMLIVLHRVFKVSVLRLLIIGVLVEFTVLSYWLAPTTVYNKIPYASIEQFLDRMPHAPSQVHNQTPLHELDESIGVETTHGLWRNLPMFHQHPSYNGYNPSRFKSYDYVKDNGYLPSIIEHPIMYVKTNNSAQVRISNIVIGRNSFQADVVNDTAEPTEVVLNQNYHHLWKAYAKKLSLPISMVDGAVMGIDLPPHTAGTVRFQFESPRTTITAIIALVTYLACFVFLFVQRVKDHRQRLK
jgi:hypothetical protein